MWAAALWAATPAGPARIKYSAIESRKLPSGTTVVYSVKELQDWLHDEEPFWAAQGIRHMRFELGGNRATGWADVDFVKAVHADGFRAVLLERLLGGERPVQVVARIESRAGKARVDLERVSISGVPLEGAALDFLIENYVRPGYPEAHVAEWFGLDFGVDRVLVQPEGVRISIGN